MGEFYKHLFAGFTKGKKVSRHYSKYMHEFAHKHFGSVFDQIPTQGFKNDFYNCLALIVHSHRHNFQGGVLELSFSSREGTKDGGQENYSDASSFSDLDFSTVRGVMYKYSQRA